MRIHGVLSARLGWIQKDAFKASDAEDAESRMYTSPSERWSRIED